MKLVIAIIKPHKLEAVREALAAIGIAGMTTSEAQGFGRQKGHTEVYRGAEYDIAMLPKARLEIAIGDEMADDVVATIRAAAASGTIGDGKIFVVDLGEVTRIRTGETGDLAI